MKTLQSILILAAFSTLSAVAAGTERDDGKTDVLYALGGDEQLVAKWNVTIRKNLDLEYSNLNHQIFEIRQEEQRLLEAEVPVQWTNDDTEWWWGQIAEAATRLSTKTRFNLAEGESGEGILETFGTQFLPNAYENYQEARAIAKERVEILNENFPDGWMSDATGGGLYEKVKTATTKAVAEMFRRHDELCHFYLLHRMGVVTERELSELDADKIAVVLPAEGPEPLEYVAVPVKPTSEERNFAQKYLPETWNAYEHLAGFLSSGAKSYADWRREAILVDATRSTPAFRSIAELLDSVQERLDDIAQSFKEKKLLHTVGETSAEELAQFDTETASDLLLFANRASLSASAKSGMENGIDFSKANRLATKNGERDNRIAGIHSTAERKISEARANTEQTITNKNRCNFEELQRHARERVVTQLLDTIVKIPGKNYSMGKYEVTQIQWGVVMGKNPARSKGVDYPVERVSWYDCQEFLEKLNSFPEVKESGLTFRLPTKEEWEFSCRAGSVGKANICRLSNGKDITWDTLVEVAWDDDDSIYKKNPVGGKRPNAFGLYDMVGNVSEWCQDKDSAWRGINERRIHAGRDYSGLHKGTYDYFSSDYATDRQHWIGFRLCADGVARNNWRHPIQEGTDTKPSEPRKLTEAESETIRTLIADMVQIPGTNYLMGKYEVTQKQWEAVWNVNPSAFENEDNPVERVQWSWCLVFVERLNQLPDVKASGLTFRMPTAGEWDYASRAGATGDYCRLVDGTEITADTLERVAWFDTNSDGKTHPVGQKEPNAFGLYDMFGNVAELIQEEWGAVAPRAMVADNEHYPVCRGGTFFTTADTAESVSSLFLLEPGRSFVDIGFRLCAEKSSSP